MNLNTERKIALLEGTLKEIIRIDKEATNGDDQVSFEDALDGRLRSQWRNIIHKAKILVNIK